MLVGLVGCVHTRQAAIVPPPDGTVPRELGKSILPPYQIEPPDILFVEVLMPPLDPPKQPYSTALPPQPINGQFLVAPDGMINLGIYGNVYVAGLTTDEARERIREFLGTKDNGGAGLKPDAIQISVSVAAYNSKVYYVITDGAGFGEQIRPFPITGSETVLDALGRIGGIPSVGSTQNVWIARRSPNCNSTEQILPVDYCGITRRGETKTNYQVLPGDRIFVQAQTLISVDNAIAKVLAPVEKILGVTLLGSSTINEIKGRNSTGTTP
jgi:polysaccharide export outer membrane protein